jgi:hypothetical protein
MPWVYVPVNAMRCPNTAMDWPKLDIRIRAKKHKMSKYGHVMA